MVAQLITNELEFTRFGPEGFGQQRRNAWVVLEMREYINTFACSGSRGVAGCTEALAEEMKE
jgi:hypothetical protein